jgi:hypothetical protein
MRFSLWFICGAIVFGLAGCDDLPLGHVLEVHCAQDTGLDNDKLCEKPDRTGAELKLRVNETTEKVQVTIIKNDGNWWVKNLILEHCSVVDSLNWKCTEANGDPNSPFYMAKEYGMVQGRYYHSLTGGNSPDYYTSSISGLTFWKLYYGLIDLQTALTTIGYSARVISTFDKK